MALKLFRRHESKCTKGYQKEDRIYENDSMKRTGKAQCCCTVYVEGKLLTGKYLRPKSTGVRRFEDARTVADHLDQRVDAKPITASESQEYETVSFEKATEDFLAVTQQNGATDRRLVQYRQLLTLRLLPFVAARKKSYIQEADSAQFWSDFRLSWRNENPLRNKSPKKGEAVEQKPLMRSTQSRMISDLRSFLAHCLSREWLSDNWATKKHKMMTTGKRKTPKQPFPEKDLMFIYRACELLTDGRGFNSKRIQTPRGFESLVFLWLMRYTGLRISDVVALRADQIVPFQISTYTHALSCRPGKTERSTGATVQIPLPNGKLPGDPDIVGALAAISLKHDQFFFFNPRVLPIYCGCVERHCDLCSAWKKKIAEATNNWRDSLTRVFNLAEKLMEKEGTSFSVHPHPHRFRHTFAARWLEAGASLRMVAQFLGDTEEVVLRHYGGFHQVENQIAAQTMAELALKRTGKQPVMQSLLNPWQPTP